MSVNDVLKKIFELDRDVIVCCIMRNSVTYAGHLAQREETRNVYRILVGTCFKDQAGDGRITLR
jgi:hypothetical protein